MPRSTGSVLLAVSLLCLMVGCGSSSRPLTGPLLVTAQSSLDPGIQHWESNSDTGGPYLYLSFHADGTGILNPNNSLSQVFVGGGADTDTRMLYDTTWNEPSPGVIVVTIAPGGWEVTFTNIVVAPGGATFSATVTSDLGDVIEMTFTLMPGEPHCC